MDSEQGKLFKENPGMKSNEESRKDRLKLSHQRLRTLQAFLEAREPCVFSEVDIEALWNGEMELLARVPFISSMHPIGWKRLEGEIAVSCYSTKFSEGKIGLNDFIACLSPKFGYAVLDRDSTDLLVGGTFAMARIPGSLVPNAPVCYFPPMEGCDV